MAKPTEMKTYDEINNKLSEQQKESLIVSLLTAIKDSMGDVGTITVDLHNMTGTLSDGEFAKIQKNNCVITVGTQYYYKQYSAATVIRYGAVPRLGAGEVIFDYVDVDRATKEYEIKHEEYSA